MPCSGGGFFFVFAVAKTGESAVRSLVGAAGLAYPPTKPARPPSLSRCRNLTFRQRLWAKPQPPGESRWQRGSHVLLRLVPNRHGRLHTVAAVGTERARPVSCAPALPSPAPGPSGCPKSGWLRRGAQGAGEVRRWASPRHRQRQGTVTAQRREDARGNRGPLARGRDRVGA